MIKSSRKVRNECGIWTLSYLILYFLYLEFIFLILLSWKQEHNDSVCSKILQTDEYDIKDVELNSNSYTLQLTQQIWN